MQAISSIGPAPAVLRPSNLSVALTLASLLNAMSALALTSASTITPDAIEVAILAPLVKSLLTVPVTSPVTANVRVLLKAVAVSALPVKSAVIVPAVKSPDASRATIALAVLASVAVVALLLTLPAVLIVSRYVSTMALPSHVPVPMVPTLVRLELTTPLPSVVLLSTSVSLIR